LDTCENSDVIFREIYRAHKGFGRIGESDTIVIDDLVSVKKSLYSIKGNEGVRYLSNLSIKVSGQIVFVKDSVLGVGMYSYNKAHGVLVIPIIVDQNSGDLSTETKLYIVDLAARSTQALDGILTNCSFSLSTCDGEMIVYMDADKLMIRKLSTNVKVALFNFNKPLMSTFKIVVSSSYIDLYYFDSLLEYYENGTSMKRARIPFEVNICNEIII
jgi:hypothetical protein